MRLLACLTALLTGGMIIAAPITASANETAIFAGGCFWCMQPAFDKTAGVVSTTVGYTGGTTKNPSYEDVISDSTGHYEAIKVEYDPTKVAYTRLLEIYWENIDPLDEGGQFADRGQHYRTVIFVANDTQRTAAEASKKAVAAKFAPQKIATSILPAKPFYAAEDYHQKYYEKNKVHYTAYKYGSGRVSRLKELWDEESRGR